MRASLEPRLTDRINEFPLHSPTTGWVRNVLRPILDQHGDYAGLCGVCKAGDPGIVGPFSRLQAYPCETVQTIMDAVDFGHWELAHAAVATLVADLGETGAPPLTVLRSPPHDDRDATTGVARFAFEVVFPKRGVFLLMPGVELAQVRPGPDGPIKALERIYVDGSSWAWPHAVNILGEARGRS